MYNGLKSQLCIQHYIMVKFANWIFDFTGGEYRGKVRIDEYGVSMFINNIFYTDNNILFFELIRNSDLDVYPSKLTLSISSDKKYIMVKDSVELEDMLNEFIHDPVVSQTFNRLTEIVERKRQKRFGTNSIVISRDNPNN